MRKKSLLALLMSVLILLGTTVFPAADGVSYEIISPYNDIDWSTIGAYKSNFHVHTTFSDGNVSLKDVTEAYYALGYHVLAVTDHGVVGLPWDKVPQTAFPLDIQNWFKERPVLTAARIAEMAAGVGRDGGVGMVGVPTGIEMNAAVLTKSHVNGFFAAWGQGYWGIENDYRTAIACTQENGGISFINHPGDWLGSSGSDDTAKDPTNVNFFADILREYSSCLGIEIYNRVDTVTRRDRVLWDELLRRLIPEGRTVWGFANDDSHALSDIGSTAEFLFMKDNSLESIRAAMENGVFLASSRYDRLVLGDDFQADLSVNFPMITKMKIDDKKDIITLETKDTTRVEWIADGKVIATGGNIHLRDYADKITTYVRAQLTGPGGITTTQAFICDDEAKDFTRIDDGLKGWDRFKYYFELFLQSNILVQAIIKIIDAIK
ncbi:MAG: PHP domain-containing protein [Oscillospiraceae bacterium]|jgi:hypothetical protein|nr:PHP domain-containing protein [Oscillospiraceae bacterium]